MNREQQIRDAYKTTLGRDVESDGSLGYWMNQGDNWQSAFNKAAAAELAARPSNTNYPPLTGTQTQQQKQITDSAQQLYGRTAEQLTAAGQGYGTGIGLYPGEGAADPNYMAYKSYNDDMQRRMNEAGRTAAPAGAEYRSSASYDPQTGSMVIRDKNGVNLTQWNNGGLIGSDWATLDRLGVDPASLKTAAAQMQQAGNPQAANYWHSANNYKPLYASSADAGMLRQGLDPTKDASPFFGASTPTVKEFMDRTGLSFEAASGALSSTGLGSAGAALVDWDKVMASPDPARALNAAYAAIAADPRLSAIASQAVSKNYAGWNIGGVGVAGGASGGGGSAGGSVGYGGGPGGAGVGAGGGGPLGIPTTGINLSQLQGPTGWSVAPNQTVQSQLEQVIAADSPLMQQARTRALQQANQRGLLNSSMAATAGQSAVLDAATPIAQQDARTYSEAARFNSDASNTFGRDNNAFVRDAFMADFNLAANEWAAQQDFARQYQMLTRQQQLQLERDAVQNGYQTARDRYTNEWSVSAADKENALRLQLAEMDNPNKRLQTQVEANRQEQALTTLNNARSNYASQMITIATSGLSGDAKDKAIGDLTVSTNAIIQGTAQQLGWSPDSWLIKIDTTKPADKPAADAGTTTQGGDGGGGGA